MSDNLRGELAVALDKADDKIQHGIGWGGYNPNGLPFWLVDAILPIIEARESQLRADVERLREYVSEREREIGAVILAESERDDARADRLAALARVADLELKVAQVEALIPDDLSLGADIDDIDVGDLITALAVFPATHLKHSLDGYPLCWPMDREGDFDGTTDESMVTCHGCLTIVAESADEGSVG